MTDEETVPQPDPRLNWFIRGTVALAVATLALYALPLPPDSLSMLRELLLLAAFALPLWPLSQARTVSHGEHRLSWLLLLIAVSAGLAGQILWVARQR